MLILAQVYMLMPHIIPLHYQEGVFLLNADFKWYKNGCFFFIQLDIPFSFQ